MPELFVGGGVGFVCQLVTWGAVSTSHAAGHTGQHTQVFASRPTTALLGHKEKQPSSLIVLVKFRVPVLEYSNIPAFNTIRSAHPRFHCQQQMRHHST